MGLVDFLKRLFGGGGSVPPLNRGLSVDELSRRLDMTPRKLEMVAVKYREFDIAKRTGGVRRIAAPKDELKQLQRRILQRVLAKLDVHPAVTGFEPGRSIALNAMLHAFRPVIVKMDIADFFGSTQTTRVHAFFRWAGWDKEAADLLTTWCTHKGGLPQGAPTSPRLSNLVNRHMDRRLDGLATACAACYTRYADDMTFSFDQDDRKKIQSVIRGTKGIVGDFGYRLHQKKKLRIMRRHDRQIVTGLVVNAGVNLPRPTRRWLRAVEHRIATGRDATLTEAQLDGWRALQKMIYTQTTQNPAPPPQSS